MYIFIGTGIVILMALGLTAASEVVDRVLPRGKYRVKYPDGYYSQTFSLDTARSYARMFSGRVVPATEYKTVEEVDREKSKA